MQAQAKSMKATWLSTCGGGGCRNFAGAKKRPSEDKDLNMLVALPMTKAMKKTKKPKAKDKKRSSDSDEETEQYNFEKLDIGSDSK